VDDPQIDGTQTATITAHAANCPSVTDGVTNIVVVDNEHTNLMLSIPAQAMEGQGVVTGTASISGTLSNNLYVTLTSSDTTEVLGTNAVIWSGDTNANFNLTIVNDTETDGARTLTVTASASGFATTNALITVNDNDVHHFGWAAITSPKMSGVPFSVTVTAQDFNSQTISNWTNSASVSGAGDCGPVSMMPTNVTLANGRWSGNVTVYTACANVRLTASDALGTNGVSTNFTVRPGALARFLWSSIARTQYVGVPIANVTIAAQDTNGNTVTAFTNSVALSGWRGGGGTTNVQVLSFIRYADTSAGGEYQHTLTAISSYFTSFTQTSTTTTNPAALQAELTGKQVFLIVEQESTPNGAMGALGTTWAPVLSDFVNAGGIVIVCSDYADEHLILANSGLMHLTWAANSSSVSLTKTNNTVLNEGVSVPFTSPWITQYSSSNGLVSLQTVSGSYAAVISRDVGAGHVVMIGSDYFTLGTGLDRIIANAVKWAQGSAAVPVAITRTNTGPFTNGWWTGDIAVLEVATNMHLRASDGSGHTGDSSRFSVEGCPPIITQHPQSQSVVLGNNVTFTVTVDTIGSQGYQWWFNAASIVNATNASLTISNVTTAQAGIYFVVVSNDYGATHSSNAELKVIGPMLEISFSPGQVRILWPTASAGFVLEVSTNLAPGSWHPVADSPIVLGAYWMVPLWTTNEQQFFRLWHPAP
jgi:hypothetical protein